MMRWRWFSAKYALVAPRCAALRATLLCGATEELFLEPANLLLEQRYPLAQALVFRLQCLERVILFLQTLGVLLGELQPGGELRIFTEDLLVFDLLEHAC